jgi:hypothetical protein
MAPNLNPVSPDALLKIVEQVKEDYVELPPQRQRGCPRTFSGRAFLLLAVVAVVLLKREAEGVWLDPHTKPDTALSLLRPYPAHLMKMYKVAPRVNRASIDQPDLRTPQVGNNRIQRRL